VSKPFVATAIVRLAEAGKLDLSDPVTKHLPYFRLADGRYCDITIRQILNHTSGMPEVEDYEWDRPQFDNGAAERYVRAMASERLLWAPGADWAYSNVAFEMLGDLFGKVSGLSFEDYIKTIILEPTGMNNSSFVYP
jgi:CubicO group peptidase (beta-lactamase class C family)